MTDEQVRQLAEAIYQGDVALAQKAGVSMTVEQLRRVKCLILSNWLGRLMGEPAPAIATFRIPTE